MFDSIAFKNPSAPGPLVDPGMIAECLIFYRRVKIIGNVGTLKVLLKAIPPLVVLELLREGKLEFYYLEDQIGVQSQQHHTKGTVHSLISFSSPQHTIDQVASKLFREAAKNTIYARKFARFIKPFGHNAFDQSSVFLDLSDITVTEQAVTKFIAITVPEYTNIDQIRFRIEGEQGAFSIDTNLDFEVLNECYHRRVPATHSSITPAYLVSILQGIQEELFFAATLNTEIASDAISTGIHTQRLDTAIQRRLRSEESISSFSNFVLDDSFAIRNAVNSGSVSFSDVLRVIEKGDKFRNWLDEQPPDADILRSFYRKIVEKTWAERLPTKTTRWGIFTGVGLAIDALGAGGIGTATGVVISAVDSFLLDHLLKGWKPHHYIEEHLRPLMSKKTKGPSSE